MALCKAECLAQPTIRAIDNSLRKWSSLTIAQVLLMAYRLVIPKLRINLIFFTIILGKVQNIRGILALRQMTSPTRALLLSQMEVQIPQTNQKDPVLSYQCPRL